MRDLVVAVTVVGALAGAASRADAHGRAPLTNGIALRPGDDQSIYVATTFGLLISHDDGCTFQWVCEENMGYQDPWDPKYAIAADGTIFATTRNGLRVSRDGGCSFSTATSDLPATDPARIADVWVDALDIAPTGEVWAATAEPGFANAIFVSTDNGQTFSARGAFSPDIWWKSVRVAPSNAARVYATGYEGAAAATPYFYRTDNGGLMWIPSALQDVAYGAVPVLLVDAVDAANPDTVFMTSLGANPPAGDILYRSVDGGVTWAEVMRTEAIIHDVVIHGQTVTVATQVQTSQALTGGPAYQSTNGGQDFTVLADAPQLACAAARPDGTLLGCGANWDPDFKAIARSLDSGASWTKVWRFVEMAGAVQCPEGSAEHDVCDVMLWSCPTCMSDLSRQFGAKGPSCGALATDSAGDPGPSNGGGCCDASAPGAGAASCSIVVGLLLVRRRRRAQPASASRQLG